MKQTLTGMSVHLAANFAHSMSIFKRMHASHTNNPYVYQLTGMHRWRAYENHGRSLM